MMSHKPCLRYPGRFSFDRDYDTPAEFAIFELACNTSQPVQKKKKKKRRGPDLKHRFRTFIDLIEARGGQQNKVLSFSSFYFYFLSEGEGKKKKKRKRA